MHTPSSAGPYCHGLRFRSSVPRKPRLCPTEIFHPEHVCSDFKRSRLVRCPSPAGPLQLLQACRVIDIYKYLFLSPWQPGPWRRAPKATGMNSRRARRPMASAEAVRRRPRHPLAKTGQPREVPPPPRLPRPPAPRSGRALLPDAVFWLKPFAPAAAVANAKFQRPNLRSLTPPCIPAARENVPEPWPPSQVLINDCWRRKEAKSHCQGLFP